MCNIVCRKHRLRVKSGTPVNTALALVMNSKIRSATASSISVIRGTTVSIRSSKASSSS